MRRDFIGLMEVQDATQIVNGHATSVVSARRERGLPTCGDDVDDARKLSALVEEVGEVARALHDGSALEHLKAELLDVATAATLWAWAVDAEMRMTTCSTCGGAGRVYAGPGHAFGRDAVCPDCVRSPALPRQRSGRDCA